MKEPTLAVGFFLPVPFNRVARQLYTVDPDELAGLAKWYLDLADADLVRAFELALADLIVAERHISWGLVRGRVDPVAVPAILVRNHKAPDPE